MGIGRCSLNTSVALGVNPSLDLRSVEPHATSNLEDWNTSLTDPRIDGFLLNLAKSCHFFDGKKIWLWMVNWGLRHRYSEGALMAQRKLDKTSLAGARSAYLRRQEAYLLPSKTKLDLQTKIARENGGNPAHKKPQRGIWSQVIILPSSR